MRFQSKIGLDSSRAEQLRVLAKRNGFGSVAEFVEDFVVKQWGKEMIPGWTITKSSNKHSGQELVKLTIPEAKIDAMLTRSNALEISKPLRYANTLRDENLEFIVDDDFSPNRKVTTESPTAGILSAEVRGKGVVLSLFYEDCGQRYNCSRPMTYLMASNLGQMLLDQVKSEP